MSRNPAASKLLVVDATGGERGDSGGCENPICQTFGRLYGIASVSSLQGAWVAKPYHRLKYFLGVCALGRYAKRSLKERCYINHTNPLHTITLLHYILTSSPTTSLVLLHKQSNLKPTLYF
eukprot:1181871-Prorocentrum_minimum.AAC.3